MRDNCNICGELHPAKALVPEHARLKETSKIRETAVKICLMEAAGMEREEIATSLGISKKTIAGYLYRAGKNGWLDFDDPKDQIEYQLMHKVIRNLDQALDEEGYLQSGMKSKTAVSLKIAEGALYPKLAPETNVTAPTTIVGVKIQMVNGGQTEVREGTVMGSSAYVDVEPTEPNGKL